MSKFIKYAEEIITNGNGNRKYFGKLLECEVVVQFNNKWYKARKDQKEAILAAFLEWKFGMRTMGGYEPNVYKGLFGRSVKTGTSFSVIFNINVYPLGKTEFLIMSADGKYHKVLFKYEDYSEYGYLKSLPEMGSEYPHYTEFQRGLLDPTFNKINVCEPVSDKNQSL